MCRSGNRGNRLHETRFSKTAILKKLCFDLGSFGLDFGFVFGGGVVMILGLVSLALFDLNFVSELMITIIYIVVLCRLSFNLAVVMKRVKIIVRIIKHF